MAPTRKTRSRIFSKLPIAAAALFFVTSAHAITIGNTLLVISPVQKHTHIASAFCNFVTGAPTPAGGANGCSDVDGSYSVSLIGGDNLLLNNNENLSNLKTVLLTITLTPAGTLGFAPIVNQFPSLTAGYNNPFLPPAVVPVITPTAESWIPGTGTLQFEWTIFPQPSSEVVQLNSFNVTKGGVVVPFNVSWIQNVTMQSHCPEPATWTMMTIGFGLVGWSTRRRRGARLPRAGHRALIA